MQSSGTTSVAVETFATIDVRARSVTSIANLGAVNIWSQLLKRHLSFS